jgi:hypothetical protein
MTHPILRQRGVSRKVATYPNTFLAAGVKTKREVVWGGGGQRNGKKSLDLIKVNFINDEKRGIWYNIMRV